MESKNLFFFLVAVYLASSTARADDVPAAERVPAPSPAPAASAPTGTSEASTAEAPPIPRKLRYKANLTYSTSRTAESDTRSFRGSAVDDTGAVGTGSTLPNMNYINAGFSVAALRNQSFGLSTLQNIDSPAYRASHLTGPGGNMNGIYSAHYGYRFSPTMNASIGETYVSGRKWADPALSFSYRARMFDEQGLSPRLGLGLTLPTTEKSHNDRLITQATARTGLTYVAGRWTSSGSLAYSRPIYQHPGKLSPYMFGGPQASQSNAGQNPAAVPQGLHHGHGHHGAPPVSPNDATPGSTASTDPNAGLPPPNPEDVVMAERTQARTTAGMGITYRATDKLRLGTGAGLSYVETFRNESMWITNIRVASAAYSFWKMEAGSNVDLYSTMAKYQHASLPTMMAVGFHLSYFMGEDRYNPL